MDEQRERDHHRPMSYRRPRLAVALGNTRRELLLLPMLEDWGAFETEVCVHAAELMARVRADAIDAVLVSSELPGFTPEHAAELARAHIGARTVLLAPVPPQGAWLEARLPIVVPLEAPPDDIRTALAADGESVEVGRSPRIQPSLSQAEVRAAPTADMTDPPFAVLVIASGAGSSGRSTVALGLAAALGAVTPTVLVDADLAGPSIAALLNANPRRNIFQVAYGQPATPAEWDEGLTRALQPLGSRSPHGRVLCGLPTAAMRAGVSPAFFADLIGTLRARFHHVILDLGPDFLGNEMALHRVALRQAGQVLLVTTPEVIDLLRARVALAGLETQLGLEPRRVALIVNRHDRRYHHRRSEIEWALGRPLAALIPYDHAGIARAREARRPVVLDRRSRAGRALLDLAGRVHGGTVTLPPEPVAPWWRRFVPGFVDRREHPVARAWAARQSSPDEARAQRDGEGTGGSNPDGEQQPRQDHRVRTRAGDHPARRPEGRRAPAGCSRHAPRR